MSLRLSPFFLLVSIYFLSSLQITSVVSSSMSTLKHFGSLFQRQNANHRVLGSKRHQSRAYALTLRNEQVAFLARGGGGVLHSTENRTFGSTRESQSTNLNNRVFLAVGSNLGDRFQNIATALSLFCDPQFDESSYLPSELVRTSFLHNTAPMYMTDQPPFLNGAVEINTEMSPHSLLARLKKVEMHLGRNFSEVRNGPRPVDLDVLCYDRILTDRSSTSFSPVIVETPDLVVPHPLMQEREFVLAPLLEVAGANYQHPKLMGTIGDLFDQLMSGQTTEAIRVLPLPRGRMILFNETIIMGILNVTPDSFSDGGEWNVSIDLALQRALEMVEEGAGIIDIGGESTRPGAKEIAIEEQIQRTIPVIKRIRQESDIPISIDTRHAAVARAAIEAGADIVNDVSGGVFDPDMLGTVADLGVPIILMHMRGTPETMQSQTNYDDIVDDVIDSLLLRSRNAELAGIPRWLQVVDPGIGFAKDMEGNLNLLKNLAKMRRRLRNVPILLGTSRKKFIGELTGETEPKGRDYGTVASSVAALCLGNGPMGCNILRVHNVKAAKQGAQVMDGIRSA